MRAKIEISRQATHYSRKQLFRRDDLHRIANTLCSQEGYEGEIEISLMLCSDDMIQELNKQYRKRDEPTDVLSFCQEDQTVQDFTALGDIVISLDTVERRCMERIGEEGADLDKAIRKEIRLLFCHGVLHLLGYDHKNESERLAMQQRQAGVLGLSDKDAWIEPSGISPSRKRS